MRTLSSFLQAVLLESQRERFLPGFVVCRNAVGHFRLTVLSAYPLQNATKRIVTGNAATVAHGVATGNAAAVVVTGAIGTSAVSHGIAGDAGNGCGMGHTDFLCGLEGGALTRFLC